MKRILQISAPAALSLIFSFSASGSEALARRFAKADTNFNGFLEFEEFLESEPLTKSWANIHLRYENISDWNLQGFISSKGGKKVPNKNLVTPLNEYISVLTKYGYYYDVLPVEQFALLLPRNTPWEKVVSQFDRKDRDGDGFLDPYELNIL
jgi:hypothetical protein